MNVNLAEGWIQFRRPRPRARVRLVCFHHAGGSALGFRGWPELLPDWVDVCPVQLPGRGSRFAVPAVTRMDALLAAVLPALEPLGDRPVAVLGHSMGAGIAHAVANAMRVPPVHLFVAAGRAPGTVRPRPLHLRGDADLLDYLRQLDGTPDIVFQDSDLQALVLRVLRADLELSETYLPAGPLAGVPVTAFGGVDDKAVTEVDLDRWRALTDAAFDRVMLPGGHFFVQNDPADMLRLVVRALEDV